MEISFRPATQNDFAECFAIIRASPAYGSRLDPYLPSLWHQLRSEKRQYMFVVEERKASGPHILGLRYACFLTRDFAQEIVNGLPPCLAEQIYRRHTKKRSPILTYQEIGRANAEEGLSLFAFTAHREEIYATQETLTAYGHAVSQAFYDVTKGYKIEEAFVENYGAAPLAYMQRSGYNILSDNADYYSAQTDPQSRFFTVHLTREQAMQEQGTALSIMFVGYSPPRFRFRPSEQEMLEYALENDTESWLAARCNCAAITIKKRWSRIYDHIQDIDPLLFAGDVEDTKTGGCMRQRRPLLLNYLRMHPEELRPYQPKAPKL